MHAATFDFVEYLPGDHAMHTIAPVPTPVFVIEPDAHGVHESAVDVLEYLPAGHGMQRAAPEFGPVSVIEPAAQYTHAVASIDATA